MGLPKDFPPVEIIQGLEKELELPFQYFMVSLEGEIEALFGNDISQQIVTFETKRKSLAEFEIPTFESIMGEMEKEDILSVKEALIDMVSKIEKEVFSEPVELNPSEFVPKYDDWYCP
tara:strand:+ start:515 stop:868 length:354 start_codon:yes stop_codon:yes gene_type:complete